KYDQPDAPLSAANGRTVNQSSDLPELIPALLSGAPVSADRSVPVSRSRADRRPPGPSVSRHWDWRTAEGSAAGAEDPPSGRKRRVSVRVRPWFRLRTGNSLVGGRVPPACEDTDGLRHNPGRRPRPARRFAVGRPLFSPLSRPHFELPALEQSRVFRSAERPVPQPGQERDDLPPTFEFQAQQA